MDPRHERRPTNPSNKNASNRNAAADKAPPAAVPILVWLVVTVLLCSIGFAQTDRAGMYPQADVLRTGEAKIQSCRPTLSSFGTMQTCTAEVAWEPKESWNDPFNTGLAETGPYEISSFTAVDGTLTVESHPHRLDANRYLEVIIPAGQPSGTGGLWYVLLLGVPVAISVVLLRFLVLPWIRRRNAAARTE